jgi:hypothetical protein
VTAIPARAGSGEHDEAGPAWPRSVGEATEHRCNGPRLILGQVLAEVFCDARRVDRPHPARHDPVLSVLATGSTPETHEAFLRLAPGFLAAPALLIVAGLVNGFAQGALYGVPYYRAAERLAEERIEAMNKVRLLGRPDTVHY